MKPEAIFWATYVIADLLTHLFVIKQQLGLQFLSFILGSSCNFSD
jgi:hypothetical protein